MKKKKKINPFLKYIILIIIGISFSTIAYASVSYDLEVDGKLSLGMQDGVIISDVNVNSITENSSYKAEHYVSTFLKSTVSLDNENSEVIIEVELKNTDNVKYRFDGILYDASSNPDLGTYSNSDIIPEIVVNSNYLQEKDILNEQETKKTLIKFKYNGSDFSGTNSGLLNGTIKLKFTRVYSLTYELNGGTQAQNQPTYYATGDDITLLNPTKPRSEFVGWYENENFSGNPITNLSEKSGDLTLYALFYTERDIYFQLPPDWYKDDTDSDYNVKMYIFNDTTKEYLKEWPGDNMTRITLKNGEITDIFKITISDRYLKEYDSVVFSNGKISGSGGYTNYNEDIRKRQTVDLRLNSDNYGKIFVPELYKNKDNSNEVRFFGKTNQNLSYYAWNNSSGTAKVAWPGELLTDRIGDPGYQFTFDKSVYDRMIINRVINNNSENQSHDLTIPTVRDLTFSTSNYDSDHYYFYVTRWFYGGSWYDIDDWENSEYSTWKENDYKEFSRTNEEVGAVNSYINS